MAKVNNGSLLSPESYFTFCFEDSFSYEKSRDWMVSHWPYAYYSVALYVVTIFGGKYMMSRRPGFELRKPLIAWSISLAVFSVIGCLRTAPEMVHILTNYGFHRSVCDPSYLSSCRVSGFWSWMFALSKILELGDTVFIVLRKKPLIFLHWYHHVTVLLFTWISYTQHIGPGRWYINMNYAVHSLMYTYYAFRALGCRLPKAVAMFVTLSQILQMVAGFCVTLYAYSPRSGDTPCSMPFETAVYGLFMYGTYFLLFAKLFVCSYLSSACGKFTTCTTGTPSESETTALKLD